MSADKDLFLALEASSFFFTSSWSFRRPSCSTDSLWKCGSLWKISHGTFGELDKVYLYLHPLYPPQMPPSSPSPCCECIQGSSLEAGLSAGTPHRGNHPPPSVAVSGSIGSTAAQDPATVAQQFSQFACYLISVTFQSFEWNKQGIAIQGE